jgi:hypothetical protein
MTTYRASIFLATALAFALPHAVAQQANQVELPWSCADTSVSRWLTEDDAPNRGEVEERELLEHYLARTYAPIYRFAPTERYFPTMPFYPAFLDSASTIVTFSDSLKLPLVSEVRAAYDSALDLTSRPYERRLPVPVVFYRVCDFAEPVDSGAAPDSAAIEPHWGRKAWHLWDYLRSDEQAWYRFGVDKLTTSTMSSSLDTAHVRSINRFRVIEYFTYYLQDWGLAGHPQDLEYTFVFIPEDTIAARSFRVIVGAGHDPPAPNNVLVLTGREASKQRLYHPNILVELGGHSSAPDMPPFGQFSAGLDVNWHIDDLWGTRDAQATAGLSFSGRYQGTMTYPRDAEDAVTLFPRGLGASGDEGRQVLAEQVRVSPDYLAERAHKASHEKDIPSAERRDLAGAILRGYREVLVEAESELRVAVGKSENAAAIGQQYDQKSEEYKAEIGKAVEKDVEERDSTLKRLDDQRLVALRERVRRELRLGNCADSIVDEYHECGRWLGDTVEQRTEAIVQLLEKRARRIPLDALMKQLLAAVPDPDLSRSALDGITSEIRNVVTERLKPEYTLLPIRYLQGLYRGARDSNPEIVKRHAKLITRLLHPAICDELACGLSLLRGESFDSAFDEVICGRGDSVPGAVFWRKSLACRFDDPSEDTAALMDSLRMWDSKVFDVRLDGFGSSKEWPGHKHKIWEHKHYRKPEEIFRTNLFRPTSLQVKRARGSVWSLFHLGYNLDFGRASNPYVGIIVPALRVVGKIPGYLAFQAGPYLGQPYRGTDPSLALSLLYDRQFVYFYGLFLKAQWVDDRSRVEGGSGASEFAWTFGASLWCPCLRRLHVRPGLRFDTDDLKPLLDRTVFELQLEYRR